MNKRIRIGELAKLAGVNIQTIRYYERRGLLTAPVRLESGYREYTPACLERMQFIRRAQNLGFTLAEIEELLTLRHDENTTAAQVKERALAKVAAVEKKIADLENIRRALSHLADQCRGGDGPVGDCPILDALGSREICTHTPPVKTARRAARR